MYFKNLDISCSEHRIKKKKNENSNFIYGRLKYLSIVFPGTILGAEMHECEQ